MSAEEGEDDASWETPAAAAARVAQARALRGRVATGGLRIKACLPSDLALWVLDRVERGAFADPPTGRALGRTSSCNGALRTCSRPAAHS